MTYEVIYTKEADRILREFTRKEAARKFAQKQVELGMTAVSFDTYDDEHDLVAYEMLN